MSPTVNYEKLPTWAKNLYTQTTARAKKRGDKFELTREQYAAMFSEECQLTGIPFDTEKPKGKKRPFAASIDRIDSARGYSADNCRLVCVAVNVAMNEWGESVLYAIATGLTRDAKKWRKGAGKLPRGVSILYVTKDGPGYRGSKMLNGKRVYTGIFNDPQACKSALEKLEFILRQSQCGPISP